VVELYCKVTIGYNPTPTSVSSEKDAPMMVASAKPERPVGYVSRC
jgi:hypothetical protein